MRAEKADIVLMPYNYVADARIRDRLKIDLLNDILIIDEAHNISQVIEDSSSFKLDTTTFKRIFGELGLIQHKINEKNVQLENESDDEMMKAFKLKEWDLEKQRIHERILDNEELQENDKS